MRVRFLGWEDPLEKSMATHSSMLAWRISRQKSLVGYRPQGRKEPDMTEATQHACTLLVYLLVLNCSKESSSWIEEFAIGELLS